ncbi:MAG: outer membrane lipoprotein carrier protein LolA [Cryomorphaceae bacterium]|nr:outer membrane lipoprotein carrier protein LolA [Cryomorphaceae bacterium]
MRNYSFLIALCIGFSVSVFGQNTAQQAKDMLEKVSQKVKKAPGIEINFTYTFENPRADASMKQEEKGSIVMAGENYRLQFMGIDRLATKDKIYTFLHDDKEVQVMDADEEEEGFSPGFILDMYKKGFSYAMGKTGTINGRKVQHILLKSLKSSDIDEIEVVVFTDDFQLAKLIERGRNGGITTFTVNTYKEMTTTPNLTFSRKAYMAKGYYIAE